MSFKINLKPNPAAEYFTVREHVRSLHQSSFEADVMKKNISEKLKSLFKIPVGFSSYIIQTEKQSTALADIELINKDDPSTGIDNLKQQQILPSNYILDLSYSFPHVPDNYGEESLLIDPSLSLGIPGNLQFIFSSEKLELDTLSFDRCDTEYKNDLLLLELVLDDYLEKGMEVLLRESNYKSAVLHQLIEDHPALHPVVEKSIRSKTMILAESDSVLFSKIEKMGYEIGHFTQNGKSMIVIANYPTHSKELIEMFADRLMTL